ncbi:MAG: hypothetical protein EOM41_01135 [Bacilli bacterium]|nr:hypothetical protein [Bacilli bacterium]
MPESLMVQANQLALAIGTSEDDVNTFQTADWTDGTGNFAVCSTRAVEKIFDYVGLVDTAENTLLSDAMAALSFVTVTTDAEDAQTITGNDTTKIRVVVDMEPFAAIGLLGLHRIEVAE